MKDKLYSKCRLTLSTARMVYPADMDIDVTYNFHSSIWINCSTFLTVKTTGFSELLFDSELILEHNRKTRPAGGDRPHGITQRAYSRTQQNMKWINMYNAGNVFAPAQFEIIYRHVQHFVHNMTIQLGATKYLMLSEDAPWLLVYAKLQIVP